MKNKNEILSPFKGKDRKSTVALTCLFGIKIANDYLAQNQEQSIRAFVKFLDDVCIENCKKIEAKGKLEKWEFVFGEDDIYKMEGEKAEFVASFAIDKIIAANKFIKATIRMFWDKQKRESDDLIKYLAFLTNNIKKF